jgi:hypothetical protein
MWEGLTPKIHVDDEAESVTMRCIGNTEAMHREDNVDIDGNILLEWLSEFV